MTLSKDEAEAIKRDRVIPDDPSQPGDRPQAYGSPLSGGVPLAPFDPFAGYPERGRMAQGEVYGELEQPLVSRQPKQSPLSSQVLIAQQQTRIQVARPTIVQVVPLTATIPATATRLQLYAQPVTLAFGTSGIYRGMPAANGGRLFLPAPGDWLIDLELQAANSAAVAGQVTAMLIDASNPIQALHYGADFAGVQDAQGGQIAVPAGAAADILNLNDRLVHVALDVMNPLANPATFEIDFGTDAAGGGTAYELPPGATLRLEGRTFPTTSVSVFNNGGVAQPIAFTGYLYRR